MPTKRSSDLICSSCQSAFPRPSNRGRLPLFCSPSCRSSAYRARTTVRPGVPPEHDEEAVRVAEDTRAAASALLAAARSLAPGAPLELVSRAVTIRQDAEDMLAVAVRRARSHGATWQQIGLATSLAADSARGHWSSDQVARTLERRRRRAATVRGAAGRLAAVPAAPTEPAGHGPAGAAGRAGVSALPAAPGAGHGPDAAELAATTEATAGAGPAEAAGSAGACGVTGAGAMGSASPAPHGAGSSAEAGASGAKGLSGSPGSSGAAEVTGTAGRRGAAPRAPGGAGEQGRRAAEQLALAMGQLRTRRGSARAVARRIGVSASLLSLVLAGKRLPSWEVTEDFARACGADPGDLAQLWEQAHGIAPAPPTSPSESHRALRTALRGLYLAAREPDLPALGRTDRGLSHDQLACLVDASASPPLDWPVFERVVSALGGRPEDVRPLWWQATYALRGTRTSPPPVDPQVRPGPPAAAFG